MKNEKILQIIPATPGWFVVFLQKEKPFYFLEPVAIWALREVDYKEIDEKPFRDIAAIVADELITTADEADNYWGCIYGDEPAKEQIQAWKEESFKKYKVRS